MSNNNFDEIINGIKGQNSKKGAEDYLMKQLSTDQSKRLQEVLSDRSALEKLLATPQAQELLKKFMGDKNG